MFLGGRLKWFAFLALMLAMTPVIRADFILWNDERMTVDSSHGEGNLYDTSHADIVAGGQVSSLYAHNSSTVSVEGGSVTALNAYESSTADISDGSVSSLIAYEFSIVDMLGGTINGALCAHNSSVVHFSGGNASYLYTYESSIIDMSSGTASYLYANDFGTVNMSGGTIEGGVNASESSIVNISGGLVKNNLSASGSSIVTFYVRDFRLGSGLTIDGNRLLGTGILSGEWVDATRWEINIAYNYGAEIFISLVEPGDANCDGVVNENDAALLATNWLTSTGATWRQGDFSGDGTVNDIDATLLAANWQNGSAQTMFVPEPSSILLASSIFICLMLPAWQQKRSI